ncbi:trypsin-like peptidase domain-containing protein [Christensenellaceae bacterium OttesenSCG-928-L17]|nr:trypsin-like peptidase domain-containing protein [Christensenellaceae bacterium OttesenSCG-928-L17]
MEYENYYEDMEPQNDPNEPERKKGGFGRAFRLFVGLVVVLFIFAVLLMGVISSLQNPNEFENIWPPQSSMQPGEEAEATPDNNAIVSAEPTPFPQERPMIALDGVAPELSTENANPIPDIVDAVAPSVVGVINYVNSPYKNGELVEHGMGSGFVISSEGYILTNAHVVQDASAVSVTILNGKEIEAKIVAYDKETDVAVLKVDHKGLVPLKLGDSENIRVGDYVVAIGNPLGFWLEGTVTMGIISARSRVVPIDGRNNYYIQTDAAINIGNSGGPLLNMKGEVIGINTAKTINAGYDEYGDIIAAEGLGFALPMSKVRTIAEHLITKGYVPRAALGVYILQLTTNELDALGLEYGSKVESVARNSPAENAGILAGDIIIACDGTVFEEQIALVEYINAQPFGTTVNILLQRDGKEMTILVTLGDKSSINYNDVTAPEEEIAQ